MENNETNRPERRVWPVIAGTFAVIVLIIVGLLLPPISLAERLGLTGAEEAVVEPVATQVAETEAEVVPDAPDSSASGPTVSALPFGELATSGDATLAAAASAIPARLTPVGDAYILGADAAAMGQMALPLGGNVGPLETLDLFGWDGSAWVHVPSQIDANAQAATVLSATPPQVLVLAQRAAPETTKTLLQLPAGVEVSEALQPLVGNASVMAMTLAADGTLSGEIAQAPAGATNPLLQVSNVAAIVDQAALTALLNDPAKQSAQISALVSGAKAAGYTGVHIDYQGVPAAQGQAYTEFVRQLGSALDAEGLDLAVTLGEPAAVDGQWITGGQDWAAIGQIADSVFVDMPHDPTAYTEGGRAQQLLQYATGRIDRDKITAQIYTGPVNRVGEAFTNLRADQVLDNFGQMKTADGETTIAPGTPVEVALDGSTGPLEWDGTSLTYKYTYERDGETQEIWFGSEAALLNRLQLAKRFNLNGVSVSGLNELTSDAGLAAVLASAQGQGEPPAPTGAAIAWTVRDATGSILASETGDDAAFSFTGTEAPGIYTIVAELILGDEVAELSALEINVQSEVTGDTVGAPRGLVAYGSNVRTGPGTTYAAIEGGVNPGTDFALLGRTADLSWLKIALPDGTEGWLTTELVTVAPDFVISSLPVMEADSPPPTTAEQPATVAQPTAAAEAAATAAPGSALPVNEARGQVTFPTNVRTGPGLTYGTIAGGVNAGTTFDLIGRSNDTTWLNVRLPDGQEGWIYTELVTVSAGFSIASLPAVAAPEGAAAPVAPAPVIPAPVGNVGTFELGGQAAGFPADTMRYAGMTWVKKQHKWSPGDSPQAVAGMINEAKANGFKILLSMPGQLFPSSIDFASYIEFLGGVAALGPDAIEVWNEMNIDREWPAGQIDPASYVNNMLKPAYQKIKSVNPNVMVIAGAPAPTGYFGGCSGAGCNDDLYVAGMMAAGARSASDCMGVHYNEGLLPPAATSGDPRGSGGHYTRYFQGMINAYTAAGAGPLCFTELGYLSGEEWGSLPSGFLWKPPYNLTVAEHAQYLAEAVRVSVQSGRVRMMIVFNVDFKTYDTDPQAGYAMIRPGGGCPACETLRAVMGQ